MDAPVTVTREVELDVSVDELWSLIGDGSRWHEWLVDDGSVDVRPGAAGVIREGDDTRYIRVRTVDHGERVTFDWWTDDERSTVELEIVRSGDRSGLRVTETFASASANSSRAAVTWDVRLLVLCLGSAALMRT